MTITEPIFYKNKLGLLLKSLTVLILVALLAVFYLYKEVVSLRHDIEKNSSVLQGQKVVNAELKDGLYKITDKSTLQLLAKERNLVEDKNPIFFKEGSFSWVVAR
jgi:cell division protein FtsL